MSAAEANWAQDKPYVTKPRARENSKQATAIQMLMRAEGATVRQIMESTGWQAHTVRGTFVGALKKKHRETETGMARKIPISAASAKSLPAAAPARTPCHAGISGKKKGPEIIRALQFGGGGGN